MGRGDDHRVHRAVIQQFAEVGIGARLAIGELEGLLQIGLVDIADGQDLGLGLLLEIGPGPCGPCRHSRSRRCRHGHSQRGRRGGSAVQMRLPGPRF